MLCFLKSKLVKTHQETFFFSCVLAEGSRGKVRAGKGLGWRHCWWVRRAIESLEPASLALGRSFTLQTGSLGTRAVPAASFAFASAEGHLEEGQGRKKTGVVSRLLLGGSCSVCAFLVFGWGGY